MAVTGVSLTEQRCAYRLQHQCGGLMRAWFEVAAPGGHPRRPEASGGWYGWARLVRKHLMLGPRHLGRLAASVPRRIGYRQLLKRRPRELERTEQRLFAAEVEDHRRRTTMRPTRVADPRGPALAQAVRGLNPSLVVASNPVLVSAPMLAGWPGPVLVLHPGWSPGFPGGSPVEQALFHRDLNGLAATVHLLTADGELGPLVRRSHPCLTPWDSPEACLIRVLALGAELLCEVVQEIVRDRQIVVYDPPADSGIPWLTPPLNGRTLAMLRADFAEGWLATALQQARQF